MGKEPVKLQISIHPWRRSELDHTCPSRNVGKALQSSLHFWSGNKAGASKDNNLQQAEEEDAAKALAPVLSWSEQGKHCCYESHASVEFAVVLLWSLPTLWVCGCSFQFWAICWPKLLSQEHQCSSTSAQHLGSNHSLYIHVHSP